MLAAAINIPQFVLDGAIWKLRNTRIGGVLIRSRRETGNDSPERSSSSLRTLVWGACGIGVLAALFVFVEMELRFDRTYAKNDWPGVQNILDRARWFGRDRADTRRTIARQLYVSGDTQAAIENYQRAIALTSTVRDFGELGWIQQKSGNLEDAEDRYLEGLNRQPEHPLLLLHLGRTQLQSGQTDAAVQTFERLGELTRRSRDDSS